MFFGWALSFEPRMRSWAPWRLAGLCFLFEVLVAKGSLLAVVVRSSAFAEPRYCQAPPSTASNAATANSRGRVNELMVLLVGRLAGCVLVGR